MQYTYIIFEKNHQNNGSILAKDMEIRQLMYVNFDYLAAV